MELDHQPHHRRFDIDQGLNAARGFSLVELIIVIVLISIAAVPLLGLFQGVGSSIISNDDLQVAQQTTQACGEQILGLRRRNPATGFASITTTGCNGLAVPAGFTRALTVNSVTNATLAACPTGASCKNVSVAVTKGTLIADLSLLLTNY
ncbi:MAG: prepilin-type N-terminal cleavage/methylation domain-containing protein [Pseudomonadota bacterium]